MLPRECKRLAEVDFPVAAVSKHSAREKSIRHGHPSTLHLWWARRPLAACRAVLMALLLPDPCDRLCPGEFKEDARKVLGQLRGVGSSEKDLQRALLAFIADFSNWDNSASPEFLEVARALVRAAHPDGPLLVVDPFAGGGSIPLEALRVGCEAFASDLNPVACLILKSLLEQIPRYGHAKILVPTADGGEEEVDGLAEAARRVGALVLALAEKELAKFYPAESDGSRPIAYVWARTVRCEAPNCGAEIPLLRSCWLSRTPRKRRALRYRGQRDGGMPRVDFDIFAPASDRDVQPGTISQGRATCPCCDTVLSAERVRAQLRQQRGGTQPAFDDRGDRISGARLLVVVCIPPNTRERHYRTAVARDYDPIRAAENALTLRREPQLGDSLAEIPTESFHDIRPSPNARGLSAVTRYGIRHFAELYLRRQLFALSCFTRAVRQLSEVEQRKDLASAIASLMALTLSRVADYCSAQSRWDPTQERNVNAFGRQALPMLWDFAELVPIRDCVGSWTSMLGGVVRVIEKMAWIDGSCMVQCADATESPLPSESADIWFTDPPYYDSVPYADLSDFFYVWLKRALPGSPILRNAFEPESPLTPKLRESVWNQAYAVNGKQKDKKFFEETLANAFAEGHRIVASHGVGCVVFAHKTTEGWEALLSGLIRGGWVVSASWPIATEQAQRLMARGTAALASSVHLICRPRDVDQTGEWEHLLRELPGRVQAWMTRLQSEGIRGADLVFACIGPALEIFSRYSRVETAEGREVTLPEFLEKIWEVVGRAALRQVLDFSDIDAGALEEDARLTALFLWTLQSAHRLIEAGGSNKDDESSGGDADEEQEEVETGKTKRFSLVFDVVRRFAQPLGIRLPEWEGRVIEIKKGVVRLLPIEERASVLFGQESADLVAERIEHTPRGPVQLDLLLADSVGETTPPIRVGRSASQTKSRPAGSDVRGEAPSPAHGATTLDRIHAAMLLQRAGHASALRLLLRAEIERGPEFSRLANALSALYPKGSEEKRLLDAVLLAGSR